MIITVSRQYGSDGETVARSVAGSLGLKLLDREAVRAAALEAGVSADLLQRLTYVGPRNVADEIMQGFGALAPGVAATAANPLLGIFAPPVSPDVVSLEEAAQRVGGIIKNIAGRGNALVLGQGGQALLRGQPGVCHVLFVAPLGLRTERVAQWHHLTAAQARRRIRETDEARRDYLARYHNVRWLDPLLYHLVINTGAVPVEAAAKLVIQAAQALVE
jgi:cytidylate kinase